MPSCQLLQTAGLVNSRLNGGSGTVHVRRGAFVGVAAGVVRTVKDSSVTSRDGVGTRSVFRVARRATSVYRCTREFGDMYSLTGALGGRVMIGQGQCQCLAAVCKCMWTVLDGVGGGFRLRHDRAKSLSSADADADADA